MKPFFKPIPLILLGFSAWITFVCASLLQFDDAGNLVTHSYSVWGDWSVHFTFISALSERGMHWLAGDNPLFPGNPFQYPFLSHLLTYLFSVITRLDVIHATYISSLLLIFILPLTLFHLFRKFGLAPFSCLLSTLCFLLIGGTQWIDSSLNAKEPFTNQFNEASIFTQFILFEFFPQRAFLFGLLAFSGLLAYGVSRQKWSLKQALIIGAGASLFSLLHIHTWIAMGTYLLALLVFPLKANTSASRKNVLIFGASVAAVSALFLGFLLLRGRTGASQSQWDLWYPGWAQNPKANIPRAQEMNFFFFWVYNTGIYLPLAAVGIYLSRKDSRLQALALAGSFLFCIALLFNIQPYFYDNLKLFTYAFFFLAPFVGIALASLVKIRKLPRAAAYSLAIALTAFQVTAGALDLYAFQNKLQTAVFFTPLEFELAQDFKKIRKSAEDIVLVNPKHNHWVPCLTGNPVILGYEGWLWSWGINYSARDAQVHEILRGGSQSESLIKTLGIRYIAIDVTEKMGNEPINTSYLENHFQSLISRGNWRVYSATELKSPSTSVR